jgi:hypothetical protein
VGVGGSSPSTYTYKQDKLRDIIANERAADWFQVKPMLSVGGD